MDIKLNAKSAANQVKNRVIIEELLKRYNDPIHNSSAKFDRFGHVIVTRFSGKKYRYKFTAQVIRREIQVIHEATQYSPEEKQWVRTRSFTYSDLYAILMSD